MNKLNTNDHLLKNAVMRCFSKFKRLFRNRKHDVYCTYCTSCGETGCCSPTSCINHKKGFYCQTNQDALKISYWTLKEFWKQLDEKKYPEVEKILREIHSKNYEEQYAYRKELNDKSKFSPAKNVQEVEEWCKRQLNRIVNR